MKRNLLYIIALMLTIAATGQTLNVKVGNVTYQFPANQTGEMTYANGETLTIMGKTFTLADISSMTVDNSEVTDNQCTVSLAGVTLTNPSGAAINITNSKRIQVSAKKGTENTLADGSSGSQKFTGGSSVNLSSYTGGGSGPGGGGSGGGGQPGGGGGPDGH